MYLHVLIYSIFEQRKKPLISAVHYLAPLCALEIVMLICFFASSMQTASERTAWYASSLSPPIVILTL